MKWTYVSDQNTRELQLRGGQIQVDEFPPFNSIKKLQNTPGVKMFLFPSTRTDYLEINQAYAPLADVHVRRAISYAIDRAAIVKAVLFGFGKPANSFMPPQVPYYDPNSPGIQYDIAEGEGRAREVEVQGRLHRRDARRRRRARTRDAIAQILQQALKALKINVTFRQVDTSTEFTQIQDGKYQLGIQLLDDGHRRPGRARRRSRSTRRVAARTRSSRATTTRRSSS